MTDPSDDPAGATSPGLRIAIDARAWDGPPTGITWYVRTLISALASARDNNRYLLLRHAPPERPLLTEHPRFEQQPIPAASDLWLECNLHSLLEEWEADLYHSPFAAPPVVRPCPAVMTVHDIIPRVMPELVDERFRAYFEERLVHGLRRADHLITPSAHTARDVATFYGVPADRSTIVSEAAPPEHIRAIDAKEADLVLAEAGVRRAYLLSVGAIEPRKNVSRLLEAFEMLCVEHGPSLRLVVVGAARDRSADVARALESAAKESGVVWLEEASSSQLAALYSRAFAFVFPSLYEGFGLPVLEAMSHGLPVIASRVSSVPELVGEDGGILVDPYDPRELAGAMHRLVHDDELRRSLGAAAKSRAEQFSLARMAEGTLAAYEKAVAGVKGV